MVLVLIIVTRDRNVDEAETRLVRGDFRAERTFAVLNLKALLNNISCLAEDG